MKIKTLSLGPLGTNCYIVSDKKNALVFDPGGDAEQIVDYLKKEELNLEAIVLTHAHFDHIGGVDYLRKEYDVKVYMHEKESDWLENPDLNRSILFLGPDAGIKTNKPEELLQEGEYELGNFKFEVAHTPGHSPGSISFIFKEHDCVISGDVLFHHGIGRTDLPGGSIEELATSILNKLYTLPDNFVVYPGHGTSTTIGIEKSTNPYTNQFKK